MTYDIYGNNLRPGYCEVHPTVHEPYPCSLCVAQTQREQQQPEYDKVGELEHYLGQARQEIERLSTERSDLRRALYEIKMYADSATDPNVNKKASIQKIQTICGRVSGSPAPWCDSCQKKHDPDCEVHHHLMSDGRCTCQT